MLTKKMRNAMMLEINGGCAHDHTADEHCCECIHAAMRLMDEEDGLINDDALDMTASDDAVLDMFLRGETSELDIEIIRGIELSFTA